MSCHPFSEEPPIDPKTFVIESMDNEGLFWSNEDGWVPYELATHYTASEHVTFPYLPKGGHWLNTAYFCPKCGCFWEVHSNDGSCLLDESIADPLDDYPDPGPGYCCVCHNLLGSTEFDICTDCESSMTIEPSDTI